MSEFPFVKPEGSDADMFIQWKGTEVCLDFTCGACGRSSHYDGGFAYFLRCGCGEVYRMGTQVIAKRTAADGSHESVQDLDMDALP